MSRTLSRCLLPALALILLQAVVCPTVYADPKPSKPGAWEAILNKDGIEVHRRQVEGSKLLEFRGRGLVNAPLPRLLAVLQDADRRIEWNDRCTDSRLIQQVTPRIQISYNRTQAPWPVADRDAVLRGETSVNTKDKTVTVSFHSVDDPRMPPQKGVVRMPHLRGHWHFTPVYAPGAKVPLTTYAEYQVHADPGGALPIWMANAASKQIPYKTLLGMRRQVERRTYPEFEKWLKEQPEYEAFTPR